VQNKKRVLAVHYSQSGQLAAVIRQLLAPLAAADDIDLVEVPLTPAQSPPFPWPVLDFIDAMPETVAQVPPALAPLALAGNETFDLVILGYPVWFLSPAPAMTSFLKSPLAAQLLAGRPVVTVTACRNMWLMAHRAMRDLVAACGGRLVDHVALTDPGPTLATFITTPRWMLTGRRDRFLGLPPAGLDARQIAGSRRFGEALVDALARDAERNGGRLLAQCEPYQVDARLIDAERIGQRSFRIWSRLLRALGAPRTPLRRAGLVVFATYLVLAIILVVPLTMALRGLLAPLRRDKLAREAVELLGLASATPASVPPPATLSGTGHA
jgi:hypothetical protein